MNRKVFLIACGMSAVMLFTGCTRRSVKNVVNEVNKSIDTSMDDDPHVQIVKNGTGFDYPDITYGEAIFRRRIRKMIQKVWKVKKCRRSLVRKVEKNL